MSNSNYIRGRNFEYRVKAYLKEKGFEVIRAAGSHGRWDLVAVHLEQGKILLIQCKTSAQEEKKAGKRLLFSYREQPATVEEWYITPKLFRMLQEEERARQAAEKKKA